jgi:putative phage-type endonuclease
MYQETISVDSLIDRLYKKNKSDTEKIVSIVNEVCHQKINHSYVLNRIKKYKKYREKLKVLKASPGITQRTSEWYETRKSLITASDFAQALGEGKFGSQKQLIVKKCGYEEEKFNPMVPPLKWGCMFEPVATDIYSARNGTKVHEFGLLKHPKIGHFGASPDGINDLGIMLEIKCPFKRKINGTVPLQYFYQIQGQLDVCELDECDYLECEFKVVEPEELLEQQGNYKEFGVIAEYHKDGVPYYYYSDIAYLTENADVIQGAVSSFEEQHANKEGFVKFHHWYINVYNVVRVYRDDEFINEKLPKIREVWDKILEYRENKELYDTEITNTTRARRKSNSGTGPSSAVTPSGIVKLNGYSFM